LKRILTLLLAIAAAALSCVAVSAQSIAADLPCDLTLRYKDDTDAVVSDYDVSVYRVAQLSKTGEAQATPAFEDYHVSFAEKDRVQSASKLADYVSRDKITPNASVKTDSAGEIALTGLQTGVYLITSDTLTQGNTLLGFQPLLIDLPMMDNDSGVYAYEITAMPKPVRREILKELNVIVLWKDAGFESKRPDSVTIELYCDGELFDTQKVTSENGWRYTWSELSDSKLQVGAIPSADGEYSDATAQAKDHLINGEHSWYVVERGADGYTVTYAVRPVNNTFVVINTIDAPATPDQPLPQTGQLWWPVPILATVGVLTLVFARFAGRKRHE
jgi:hypothetical protein